MIQKCCVALVFGALALPAFCGTIEYGAWARSYNSSSVSSAFEAEEGGGGSLSASAEATRVWAPGSDGSCVADTICAPQLASGGSASLISGTLRAWSNALATGAGTGSTFADASLWDTFTIVTPANSLGEFFNVTLSATADGQVERSGNSAADYTLNLSYSAPPLPLMSESPDLYQGSRVDEYGLRYSQLYSSSWQLPTSAALSDTVSGRTTSISGELAGGVDPIAYTIFYRLDLSTHTWATDSGESSSSFGNTILTNFEFDPELSVTSASGVYGSSSSEVPEPSTLGLLGLGLAFLARRLRG